MDALFAVTAGWIHSAAGQPGRYRVFDHAGEDVTGPTALDLAGAFRLLDSLARVRRRHNWDGQ